ncbi:MAG: hypothetical protein JW909_00020 [Planctomycetes bacterium]|nr:hypothetical protein [Planctomycetota bacterium]
MGRLRKWVPALMAALALCPPAWSAEAKKDTVKAPVIVKKEDGVIYSADSKERMKFVPYNEMILKRMGVLVPGMSNQKTWSGIRKDTSDENPQTAIALPLKWPLRADTWTPEEGALKYLITTAPDMFINVDINLDGKWRGAPESFNKNDDGTYGPILLALRHKDGTQVPYSLVITNDAEDGRRLFRFRSSGAWEGYIPSSRKRMNSEKCLIFDANNNGLYDDYGADMIMVGNKPLVPLPQLILIKGKLYHLKVHPSGSFIQTKPYEGATGRIDVYSKAKLPNRTKVESLVVVGVSGAFSIDVSPSNPRGKLTDEPPIELPVGKYVIGAGLLSSMKETVQVYGGDMDPVEVKKGETACIEWGMPYKLSAEITTNITGLNVDKIFIVGSAKETYVTQGKEAPIVTVKLRNRPVRQEFISLDNEGRFATWYWNPGEKGIYKILLEMNHRILGKLKVDEAEVSYRPMGE